MPISFQCITCQHLNEEEVDWKCKAFPEVIPYDIIAGEFQHTKRHPQQAKDNEFLYKRKIDSF